VSLPDFLVTVVSPGYDLVASDKTEMCQRGRREGICGMPTKQCKLGVSITKEFLSEIIVSLNVKRLERNQRTNKVPETGIVVARNNELNVDPQDFEPRKHFEPLGPKEIHIGFLGLAAHSPRSRL
jgi:hypothetical protein